MRSDKPNKFYHAFNNLTLKKRLYFVRRKNQIIKVKTIFLSYNPVQGCKKAVACGIISILSLLICYEYSQGRQLRCINISHAICCISSHVLLFVDAGAPILFLVHYLYIQYIYTSMPGDV